MEWFYITESRDRLGFSESEVSELTAAGLLSAKTMVWSEGMDGWVAASEVSPEWFRGKTGGGAIDEGAVKEIGGAIGSGRGWWVFLGVVLVVAGAGEILVLALSVLGKELIGVSLGLVLLPISLGVVRLGLAMVRGVNGAVRATEFGQRSQMVGEIKRISGAVVLLGKMVLLSAILSVVGGVLGVVLFWEAVKPYLGL